MGTAVKIPEHTRGSRLAVPQALTPEAGDSKTSRRSGDCWFEIKGRRIDCRSLKELLSGGLRALEEARPDTLEKLSHIKPRTRRIVARDPKQLFDREHLAELHSEPLIDGWSYGTNNSAAEQ